MRTKILFLICLTSFISVSSAQEKTSADLILTNAEIYSLNKDNEIFHSMAVRDGKILELGSDEVILKKFSSRSIINAEGKPVFPGFIDAHSHFYGYALGLMQADLTGTKSFDDVLIKVQNWAKNYKGEWITGRGWDHNDWKIRQFPDRRQLDSLFPKTPVVLLRVDGHVLLANGEALKRSGLKPEKFSPGEVEMKNGQMTGILGENAADYMRSQIPPPDKNVLTDLIMKAQQNCFTAGLTTVDDAGLDKNVILFLDSLQKNEKLKLRLTVMLNPTEENFDYFMKKGKFITPRMTVRSVKIYADGSLGSRSALLKKPYSDDPSKTGITTTPSERIREVCALAYKYEYQVNIHAIGDSAIKEVLDIYAEFLKGKNDLRWRIEHAQVVDLKDIDLFGKYSVVPSVQATHATSDMYWAEQRLGPERIKGAYAYKMLMKQNGWIPNGTDFPIESINPLYTFYAAVARKDLKGFPENGFQKENALSREEAIKSITIWAAMASFDEKKRGSLETGKDADFVILEKDIMKIPEKEIPQTKILKTFSAGELVNP